MTGTDSRRSVRDLIFHHQLNEFILILPASYFMYYNTLNLYECDFGDVCITEPGWKYIDRIKQLIAKQHD